MKKIKFEYNLPADNNSQGINVVYLPIVSIKINGRWYFEIETVPMWCIMSVINWTRVIEDCNNILDQKYTKNGK
jgi:hypothetical protein